MCRLNFWILFTELPVKMLSCNEDQSGNSLPFLLASRTHRLTGLPQNWQFAGDVRFFRIAARARFEKSGQFIRELEDAESADAVIHARLRSGEEIPGFGHPLYPGGDPRAKLILQLLAENFPAEFAKIQRRIKDSERLVRKPANVDLALAVVRKVLELPLHSGFHLFALGRMVGWIAHAVEQVQSGAFIRPRARYVGVMLG